MKRWSWTLLSLSLLVWGLTSCVALMNVRGQLVAVDSHPRGARVHVKADDATVTPAVTPFVHREIHQPVMIYESDFHDGHTVRKEFDCHYQWGWYLGGNSVLTIATLGVGVLGFVVDGLAGTPWECPSRVELDAPAGIGERTECRRFVLIPVRSPSAEASADMARQWAATVNRDLGPCDDVIPFDDSLQLLVTHGFSHTARNPLTTLGNEDVALAIAKRFRATHAVILTASPGSQNTVSVTPRFVDLFNGAVSNQGNLTRDVHLSNHLAADYFDWRPRVRYWPNAVAWNRKPSATWRGTVDDVSIDKDPSPSFWGSGLASIDAVQIESVAGKDPWTLDWRLFPTINSHYDSKQARVGRDPRFRVVDTGVAANLNLGVRLFSPWGPLTLSAGAGPAFVSTGRSGHMPWPRIVPETRCEFEFAHFVAESLFLRWGVFSERYWTQREIAGVLVESSKTGFSIGIGAAVGQF